MNVEKASGKKIQDLELNPQNLGLVEQAMASICGIITRQNTSDGKAQFEIRRARIVETALIAELKLWKFQLWAS